MRVRKHLIGIFLESDEKVFTRIKKSETLSLSAEADKEENDFIADKSKSSSIKSYNYSLEQDLTMIKGEDDYEMVWNWWFNTPNKPDVRTKCLIVFMNDGDPESGYKAWQTTSTIEFTSLEGVDSKLNFNIDFSDVTIGTATMVDGKPTFVAEQ